MNIRRDKYLRQAIYCQKCGMLQEEEKIFKGTLVKQKKEPSLGNYQEKHKKTV